MFLGWFFWGCPRVFLGCPRLVLGCFFGGIPGCFWGVPVWFWGLFFEVFLGCPRGVFGVPQDVFEVFFWGVSPGVLGVFLGVSPGVSGVFLGYPRLFLGCFLGGTWMNWLNLVSFLCLALSCSRAKLWRLQNRAEIFWNQLPSVPSNWGGNGGPQNVGRPPGLLVRPPGKG